VFGVKHWRFEAYKAVVMIQIFWNVTPYYALVTGKWHGIQEDWSLEPRIIFIE